MTELAVGLELDSEVRLRATGFSVEVGLQDVLFVARRFPLRLVLIGALGQEVVAMPSGRRRSKGRRTAWVRLLTNTVPMDMPIFL